MRFRRLLVIGSVGVLLLSSAWTPSQAGSRSATYRARFLRIVNDVRAHHGVKRLDLNRDLSRYALRHSESMAQKKRLFHTNDLQSRLRTYRPRAWGENVGMAGTLHRVVRLWMKSSVHRANILDRRYKKTGIGVVRSGGRIWVTQIYYG